MDVLNRGTARPGELLPDYREYRLTFADKWLCIAVVASFLFGIGMLFYNHILLALGLSTIAVWSPRVRRRQLAEKRRKMLKLQFRQALYALSTALGAGRSVESAFRECVPDLRLLYSGADAAILVELEIVNRRVHVGEPLEVALRDFGERSGISDIMQFAEVFATCKRTGGDLVDVLRRTSNMIGEKLEIEQDISVVIAQKRFEAKALSFIPFVIIAFLAWSSPDYMAPLYTGTGRIIMTGSLALLVSSFAISRKIMNIQV